MPKNADNFRSLTSQAKGRIRIVAVSIEAGTLGQYFKTNTLAVPAYENIGKSDLQTLDFVGTPQTILLNNKGTVIHNWPGAYIGATGEAIETNLKVALPHSSSSQTRAYSAR